MKKIVLFIIISILLSTTLIGQQNNIDKDIEMYADLWDKILNNGQVELFNSDYFTEDVTVVMEPNNIVGISALKDYYQNFITGFSDIEFTIVNSFGQDDQLVKHFNFKGKHTGAFFGIPPTGKSVDLEGTTIVKMQNGKIAQEQDFFDNAVLMTQLGLVSDPANLNLINSVYSLFAEGNIPGVLELMDDKIVWNEAESNSLADGNPYIGPEAVMKGVISRLGDRYSTFVLDDIKLHEMSNNEVLATLRYVAKMKHNGRKINVQASHHWSLENGKIIRFQQYVDTKKLADSEKL